MNPIRSRRDLGRLSVNFRIKNRPNFEDHRAPSGVRDTTNAEVGHITCPTQGLLIIASYFQKDDMFGIESALQPSLQGEPQSETAGWSSLPHAEVLTYSGRSDETNHLPTRAAPFSNKFLRSNQLTKAVCRNCALEAVSAISVEAARAIESTPDTYADKNTTGEEKS